MSPAPARLSTCCVGQVGLQVEAVLQTQAPSARAAGTSHHPWLGLSFRILLHSDLLFVLSVADPRSWPSSKDYLLGFTAVQECFLKRGRSHKE